MQAGFIEYSAPQVMSWAALPVQNEVLASQVFSITTSPDDLNAGFSSGFRATGTSQYQMNPGMNTGVEVPQQSIGQYQEEYVRINNGDDTIEATDCDSDELMTDIEFEDVLIL